MKKVAFILILMVAIVAGGFMKLSAEKNRELAIESPLFYVVEKGATLTSVANELEADGVISSATMLKLIGRLEGNNPVIAASYEFPVGYTVTQLYQAITTGDAISEEVQVTFPEGFLIDEMAEALVEAELISNAQEFVTAASSGLDRFKTQFDFLSSIPEGQSLEGYLFPDTYRFFQDATVDEIILTLLRTFDAKLDNSMRQEINRQGKSIHEVITLASIVQKEVRSVDDMKTVAGLFQNRLDIGMLLQADSTIGYVTRSGRDRSTFADLEIETPYNSYKYAGLPPGPISNPGVNAIIAAINPGETDYLFFLTNRTSGIVYYGRNLAEHNRNRELYLE